MAMTQVALSVWELWGIQTDSGAGLTVADLRPGVDAYHRSRTSKHNYLDAGIGWGGIGLRLRSATQRGEQEPFSD